MEGNVHILDWLRRYRCHQVVIVILLLRIICVLLALSVLIHHLLHLLHHVHHHFHLRSFIKLLKIDRWKHGAQLIMILEVNIGLHLQLRSIPAEIGLIHLDIVHVSARLGNS